MAQAEAQSEKVRQKLIDTILENKAMCEESREVLKDPSVFCIIQRSKNSNVLIYKANMKNGAIDAENPVSVFWLKIEPSYVEAHRKKGKKDDRTELTHLESSMAFGISWEKLSEKEFKVTFLALKSRPVILKLNKDGLPRGFGKVGDTDVCLVSMYVQTSQSWLALPKVSHILLTGARVDNGEMIEDKIKP